MLAIGMRADSRQRLTPRIRYSNHTRGPTLVTPATWMPARPSSIRRMVKSLIGRGSDSRAKNPTSEISGEAAASGITVASAGSPLFGDAAGQLPVELAEGVLDEKHTAIRIEDQRRRSDLAWTWPREIARFRVRPSRPASGSAQAAFTMPTNSSMRSRWV